MAAGPPNPARSPQSDPDSPLHEPGGPQAARFLLLFTHVHDFDLPFSRKLMGLKQQGLAERLGVDVQTVANYEKGKKIPTC
jgi:hypothetical protein